MSSKLITAEIWSTRNPHQAKAGVVKLLPDTLPGTQIPWAEYQIKSIMHCAGSGNRYFSIMQGGGTGAYPIQNVRNLKVDGVPVELPAFRKSIAE